MACEEVRRTISDADGRAMRGRRVRAHLRDCSGCAVFAAAIPARGGDLRVIAPPLPAVAAAGLLARALGGGSGHGGGGGAGGLAAGAAGKTVSAALAAKALAGVVVVATATVGVTTALRHTVHTTRQPPATQTAPATATPSGTTARSTHLTTRSPDARTARRRARHGAVRLGAPSPTRAGSAGQAATAARGVGAGGSGVAHSGARAHGLSSGHAHSTPTRGVPHIPTVSGGSRGGARHHPNPPATPPAAGRPSTPGASAPATSAAPVVPSPPVPQTPTPGSGLSSSRAR
jgi:hypothetical protein